MAGLVQALSCSIERSRRQHADRPGQHGRFVGQDVAEHVAGHDDVKLLRRFHQLHGGVVHIHVIELHVGVLRMHFGDDVLPKLEGLKHVGLVDAGEPLGALARGLERHVRNALDLGTAVAHRVVRLFRTGKGTVRGAAASARLAEIDISRQLSNDQDVKPRHQLGLQARSMRQLFVADGRAEIGEQAQVLAQPQDRLLGAQRTLERVVLPVTHRAEQHSIGRPRELKRRVGQRMAVRVERHAAHQRLFRFEPKIQALQHAQRLRHDFRADAVAGQDCNFHVSLPRRWSMRLAHGRLAAPVPKFNSESQIRITSDARATACAAGARLQRHGSFRRDAT